MTKSQSDLLAYIRKPRYIADVMQHFGISHPNASVRLSKLVDRGHAKITRDGAAYIYEVVS